MYKEILLGIAGIGLFPVVSLVLFVTVFSLMLIRVAMMDRAATARLAAQPLDHPDAPSIPDTGGGR